MKKWVQLNIAFFVAFDSLTDSCLFPSPQYDPTFDNQELFRSDFHCDELHKEIQKKLKLKPSETITDYEDEGDPVLVLLTRIRAALGGLYDTRTIVRAGGFDLKKSLKLAEDIYLVDGQIFCLTCGWKTDYLSPHFQRELEVCQNLHKLSTPYVQEDSFSTTSTPQKSYFNCKVQKNLRKASENGKHHFAGVVTTIVKEGKYNEFDFSRAIQFGDIYFVDGQFFCLKCGSESEVCHKLYQVCKSYFIKHLCNAVPDDNNDFGNVKYF